VFHGFRPIVSASRPTIWWVEIPLTRARSNELLGDVRGANHGDSAQFSSIASVVRQQRYHSVAC
jgi:hypothetical protein